MRVTVGDSGLCCGVSVMSLEGRLTPLCVDYASLLQETDGMNALGKAHHYGGPVWPSGKALGW